MASGKWNKCQLKGKDICRILHELLTLLTLRHSSWFWQLCYFKSFQNAKICRYTPSVEDKVRLLRLVLFPILLFFRLPSTIIFIDREIHETIPLRFRRCFSPFHEKNSSRKTFVVEWLRSTRKTRALYGQALVKGGNFGGKLIHLCDFWLEVSFFSHVKNHRSRFWLDVTLILHEWKPSFAPLIG